MWCFAPAAEAQDRPQRRGPFFSSSGRAFTRMQPIGEMFVRPAPGQKLTEVRRDIYLRTPPLAWVDRALCRPLPSADDPDLPTEGGPDATTAIPLLQYEGRAGGLNGTVARVKSGRRTLALLDRAGNDPAATIAAFALAGLCGLATNAAALVARISSRRSASGEVPAWTTAILPDLCARLGIADPCEVRHYGGVETLPGVGRFGPADIAAGPAAFGALLCARIGALLETTLPARLHLRPIIWTDAPTIVDFDKVLAPLAAETFVPYGTAEWRAMTPDALERLVWSEPPGSRRPGRAR